MTKVPLNETVETLAATIRAVGVSSEEAEKAVQEFATLIPPFSKEEMIFLEELGVSIYKRNGKWYWMIKSHSFDSPEGALKDAISTFSRETEKKPDKKERCFA